jgi:ElaB/YqjD/DUF883 family membrane-anchored ribosome-binding protein
MAMHDADAMEVMEYEGRGVTLLEPRRPWFLITASLMLVVLVALVWFKWSESRTEVLHLRAELKSLYAEAEMVRTRADQGQQKLALLEQQVRTLTAERTELLKRQEAGSDAARAKSKAPAKPAKDAARKRPAA